MATITEISKCIAQANRWSGEAEKELHRTIRNFVKKGLVHAAPTADMRGTVVIENDQIFRVRLFIALTAVGFENEDLRSFEYAIDPPADYFEEGKDENGNRLSRPVWRDRAVFERRLDQVVSAVANGETWFFRVTVCRDSAGRRTVGGGFVSPSDPLQSSEVAAAVASFRDHHKLNVEAEIRIPVSDIFKPLLAALPNEG